MQQINDDQTSIRTAEQPGCSVSAVGALFCYLNQIVALPDQQPAGSVRLTDDRQPIARTRRAAPAQHDEHIASPADLLDP